VRSEGIYQAMGPSTPLFELLYRVRRGVRDLLLARDVVFEGLIRRRLRPNSAFAESDEEAAILAQCRQWLDDYIAQPHADLGRSGAICPFVKPALEKKKLQVIVCDRIRKPDVAAIRRILLTEGLMLRQRLNPEDKGSDLSSNVIIFPYLPADGGSALHRAYLQSLKHLNRRGIMLAVFYPGFGKGGLHNEGFKLYQSPLPTAALRPMALHDILFVSHSREGFLEYHRLFADQYRQGKVSGAAGFIEKFQEAEQRFRVALVKAG